MSTKDVVIKLKTDGSSEVKRTFADVQQSGESAFAGIAAAADDAATKSEAASDRQMAKWKRDAASAAAAARDAMSRNSFDTQLSQFGGVNFSRVSGGAREAAEAFGLLEEHSGRASTSMMILQHSMRSAVDSFNAGAPVTMILGEQMARAAEAAELSGGALGAMGGVLAGPWGLAVTAGVALLPSLINELFDTSDAAAAAKKETDDFTRVLEGLNSIQLRGDPGAADIQKLSDGRMKIAGNEGTIANLEATSPRGRFGYSKEVRDKIQSLKDENTETQAAIDLAQRRLSYNQQEEAAERSATDAKKGHTAADHGLAVAARDAAASQRDLDSSLAHLIRDFAPATAAAQDYADRLADIDKALAAKRITPDQADRFKSQAEGELDQAGRNQYDREMAAMAQALDRDFGDSMQKIVDSGLDNLKIDPAALKKLADSLHTGLDPAFAPSGDQLKHISSLADTFENAFNGGTANIWKTFESQGEHVLAELLAQWAVTGKVSLTDAAGGSGSGLGALISGVGKLFGGGPDVAGTMGDIGIPAFASGTQYAPGGMALVGENGPEEEYIPRGAKIMNAADTRRAMGDGGGGTTHVHNYDLRGAVVYEDLMTKIESRAQRATVEGARLGSMQAVYQVADAKRRRRI